MYMEGLVRKFVIGVVFLGSINLFVFLVSWKGLSRRYHCSMDSFLQVAGKFLDSNGKETVAELLPASCPNQFLNQEAESINEFRISVRMLVHECNTRKLLGGPRDVMSSTPILTLFTSWTDVAHLKGVHAKTLANWSSFLPKFNLVVFTNESSVLQQAEDHGWTVFPILQHAAGGAPVLRTMFQTVMKHFNSTFYGFANSDILFTDDLYDTLLLIASKFKSSKSVFISGRRTNVPNVSTKDAASFPNIANVANARGKLFEIHSADYFFSTKAFPWEKVYPLVIGRPAYDNFIISYARKINSTVVDATATVPAIHQTTEKGNREGISHVGADYNDKYLLKMGIKPKYENGFVTCAEWKSYETLCGDKDIVQRKSLPKYCS